MPGITGNQNYMNTCKKCGLCRRDGEQSGISLQRCAKCKWAAYCSPECQRADWSSHKPICSVISQGYSNSESLPAILTRLTSTIPEYRHPRLQRHMLLSSPFLCNIPSTLLAPISLDKSWPVFAIIAQSCRMQLGFPLHPALTHQVVSAKPEYRLGPVKVQLGRELPMDRDPAEWFPTAEKCVDGDRLFRRIMSDRWDLEVAVGIALGIKTVMYGTYGRGLKYGQEPIVDFGICAGSFRVTSQDLISYHVPSQTPIPCSDPKDHYWLYFLTASGTIAHLDPSAFIWNFHMTVATYPYTSHSATPLPTAAAPGMLFGPWTVPEEVCPVKEREGRSRFSIGQYSLSRDLADGLTEVTRNGGELTEGPAEVWESIQATLREGKGPRPDPKLAVQAVRMALVASVRELRGVFEKEAWEGWPREPVLAIMDEGDV